MSGQDRGGVALHINETELKKTIAKYNKAADLELSYVCIQVKENSLEGYSLNDGVVCD